MKTLIPTLIGIPISFIAAYKWSGGEPYMTIMAGSFWSLSWLIGCRGAVMLFNSLNSKH